ncbi:nicotinate phosphoribosyltransferase [Noviherbaspirillum sp.]|jgi:nicotinate phosphoribosyltransferase|uniref:nicotinate phosphoribosyltransferase n=1 Tax=Noviherbaspirillum sp. TaxID=1926288 RepID=UPI0025DAD957|nr:nicotinate phosphoribosyltransferase [Noviherbaspirillum sp.]
MKLHCESALLTDLYELTMLQAYFSQRMNETAVFEFFVRRLPERRNFLMAAGLEQVLSYLTELRFDHEDIAWLRASGKFSAPYIDSLAEFRFTGDVDAMPEGTVFFAEEPILRITAPLREAQFVESRIINLLQFQTMVASKAARSVNVANGKRLVDFGLRRAHGAEAGLLSARASYLAGFDATATTLAGALFDIPVSGTMAHSFIQAHESETDAFASFARAFPDNATLLIDTYDTEAAAEQVVRLAQWLQEEEGIRIKAVRLDSGELGTLAYRVREILDAGGCEEIGIFASGNLDEFAVQELTEGDAPIDGFGIGTRMNTSADAPFLDCAYKLVEYAGQPCRKRSLGKMTWPGSKQVYRHYTAQGILEGDVLALADEDVAGEALLKPVMRGGALQYQSPPLSVMRAYAQEQLSRLPLDLHSLEPASPYPLQVSRALQELTQQVDEIQRSRADSDKQRWGLEAG